MGKFVTFLVGGVVGAAAAAMLSPRNGAENRALLNETIGTKVQVPAGIQEKAGQFVDVAATTSTKAINTVVDGAADARKSVASKVSQINPPSVASLNNNGDELREKIDAARERIATQVAKNAEAARDAAVDKVPAAIDAASGVANAAKDAAAGAASAAKDAANTVKDAAAGAASAAKEAASDAASAVAAKVSSSSESAGEEK